MSYSRNKGREGETEGGRRREKDKKKKGRAERNGVKEREMGMGKFCFNCSFQWYLCLIIAENVLGTLKHLCAMLECWMHVMVHWFKPMEYRTLSMNLDVNYGDNDVLM